MPSDFQFRLSTCITLVLACAGLGYSEWDLVPGVALFTAFVVALIIAAFALDRRVAIGLRLANLLGLGIAAGAITWLLSEVGTQPDGFAALLVQPGLLLPYVGPFLMVLIPAKLFRPKHLGDWWTMQGIGLAAVALAASMSETEVFATLLGLYAISAIWSVSALYVRGAAGRIAPMASPPSQKPPVISIPGARVPFRAVPSLRLFAGAGLAMALFSVPVFLLLPRSNAERWAFGKQRMETGFNPENSHDISKAGDLGINRDVALRITTTEADGAPKNDLAPDTLWRGISYSDYEDGKWVRRTFPSNLPASFRTGRLPIDAPPPDLGEGMYRLEFRVEEGTAPVIASPPSWKVGAGSPVRSLRNSEQVPWQPLYDGSFAPDGHSRRSHPYLQWLRPRPEPALGEALELSGAQFDRARSVLTTIRVPAIRAWSIDRLKSLVKEGKLPREVIREADTRTGMDVEPKHFEAVAHAYSDYFAESPEFTYTLKLRRQDRRLDSIEDFLINTKAGHCQWYASALCLSLRALGIPAQFAMGYKGQEPSDGGEYVIRHENAHAWVEVLVPREPPADFPFRDPGGGREPVVWHWLSLDPSPVGTSAAADAEWFDTTSWHGALASLVDYLLKYDGEKQKAAAHAAPRLIGIAALLILGFVAMAVIGRRLRKFYNRAPRSKPKEPLAAEPPWYLELGRILDRHGLARTGGQTPKEYAETVRSRLRETHPEVAEIPAFVASKLYRMRFAAIPLTTEEVAALEAAIRELEKRLNL